MSVEQKSIKQTNHEMISHSETSSVAKQTDGLTFRGLDLQTGFVSPFGAILTMLYGRVISMRTKDHGTDFIAWPQLAKDHLIFMVNGEAKMSTHIYNVQVAKYPVYTESRLASYRKSSFILETSLTIPGFQKPVASISSNLVCVAKDMTKSSPLPDWWVKKFEKFFEKTAIPHFKPFMPPHDTFCRGFISRPYTFPVRRREQDYYGHVNTSSYPQFCLDALEHHLSINNINCDINTVSLLLKAAQWLHRGESQIGDILTVAFWDEETDPETVCFDISKSGQSIYQARMQFYGASEISTGTKSHL